MDGWMDGWMDEMMDGRRFIRTRVVSLGLAGGRPIEGPRREVGSVHRGDGLRDALGLGPHLVEDHSLLRLALVTIVPDVLSPLRERVHADDDGAALRGWFHGSDQRMSEPTLRRTIAGIGRRNLQMIKYTYLTGDRGGARDLAGRERGLIRKTRRDIRRESWRHQRMRSSIFPPVWYRCMLCTRYGAATDGDGGLFCTPSLPSEDASQPASVRFLRGYVPSS